MSYHLCNAAMLNYYYCVLFFQKVIILFSVVDSSHTFIIIMPSYAILSFALLPL